MLPCAANRWRTGTRLGCGQRWQAVGGEKTRCALALRQVTAGGRPSRGAEQKARCRLPEDMREAHRFRGKEVPAFAGMTLGAAQEAPSERPEGESGWQWRRRPLAESTEQGGTTQRAGAQQRRATAVSAKGGDIKKRTASGLGVAFAPLSIFLYRRAFYPWQHHCNRKKTDGREHRFPPAFFCAVGCALGNTAFKRQGLCVLRFLPAQE